MSHTRGPWHYKLKNAGNGFLIVSADEIAGNIADVYMTNDRSIAEDRARLMSAAPELIAACRAVLLFHSVGEWDGAKRTEWAHLTKARDATTKTLCDVVRAAIAKAESVEEKTGSSE